LHIVWSNLGLQKKKRGGMQCTPPPHQTAIPITCVLG